MRKKLLSLALALILCLGLAVPAMAAYEVKSDKCTYELSNDPVGTTEISVYVWNDEKGDTEAVARTVIVVPDGTTITSKTAPNGKLPYEQCLLAEEKEWVGGEYANAGEPLIIQPFTSVTYWNEGGPDIEKQVPCIFRVRSEDVDYEYYEEFNPYPLDEGVFIMAQSAAVAAGFTVQSAASPSTPTTPITPAVPSTGFTDVAADAYYAEPVSWALEKGITTGTSTTTFSPGQNCTNAQILTFLWRAYGQPEPTIGNPFTNSIPDAYTKAAVWAYEKGMVSGTAFDADKPCTRAMAVTYMWQAAGSSMPFASADSFTDVPADASYALAVAWALEKGITTGTSATTFSPDEICNRGQIVTFLHRNLA